MRIHSQPGGWERDEYAICRRGTASTIFWYIQQYYRRRAPTICLNTKRIGLKSVA
jgi:hypothetical protein